MAFGKFVLTHHPDKLNRLSLSPEEKAKREKEFEYIIEHRGNLYGGKDATDNISVRGIDFKRELDKKVADLKADYESGEIAWDKATQALLKLLSMISSDTSRAGKDQYIALINGTLSDADIPLVIGNEDFSIKGGDETKNKHKFFKNGVFYPGKMKGGAENNDIDKTKELINNNIATIQNVLQRYTNNYIQLFEFDNIQKNVNDAKIEYQNKIATELAKKQSIEENSKSKEKLINESRINYLYEKMKAAQHDVSYYEKKLDLEPDNERYKNNLDRANQNIAQYKLEIAKLGGDPNKPITGGDGNINITQLPNIEINKLNENYNLLKDKLPKWIESVDTDFKKLIDNNNTIRDNLLELTTDGTTKSEIKQLMQEVNDSLNGFLSLLKNNYEKSFQIVEAAYISIQNQNSNLNKKGGEGTDASTNTEIPNINNTKSDELVELLNNSIDILKKLNSNYLLPLQSDTIVKSTPGLSSMTVEPTLFQRLYNNYISRKNQVGDFVASKELHDQMSSNSLIPREALQISGIDKAIFIFVILILRMIAMTIMRQLIINNKIKTINTALLGYLGIYIMLFIAFVMFVNLDMYRLRIVFNYVNMHAHVNLILTHVLMISSFCFIISYLITIINVPQFNKGKSTADGSDMSTIGKDTLLYRLEIITGITFIFTAVTVMV